MSLAKLRSGSGAVSVLVLLGGVVAVGVGGCAGRENAVEDKETDAAFLRFPDDKKETSPAVLALKSGSLFPVGVGSHWEMETMQGPYSTNGSPPKEVTISRRADEKIVVTGQTVLGGQTGATFEIRSVGAGRGDAADAQSTATRQEVYAVTQSGLYLLAAGEGIGRMTMSPPLPLVPCPPKEGQAVSWNGVLHYKNATAPASCISRITSVDTVKTTATPKGISAYRVDTIVSTTLVENGQSRQISFPTTRWLAPGIGLVRQKLLVGDQMVIKDLKSFEIVQK